MMLSRRFIPFVAAMAFSFVALSQQPAMPVAPAAKPLFQSVGVEQFASLMGDTSFVVVDVRTPKEFAEGHLQGAVNVPWDNMFDRHVADAALPGSRSLAVYCRSGRRSKAASKVLVGMGFKVVELDKGIIGWQQQGKQVVR